MSDNQEITKEQAVKFIEENSKMNENGTGRTLELTSTRKFFSQCGIDEKTMKTVENADRVLREAAVVTNQNDCKQLAKDNKDKPLSELETYLKVKYNNDTMSVTTKAEIEYTPRVPGQPVDENATPVKTAKTFIKNKSKVSYINEMSKEGITDLNEELKKLR